jgi:hypothetical protein
MQQGLDLRRNKLRSSIGLNEKGGEAMGSVLQQLGLQLMAG